MTNADEVIVYGHSLNGLGIRILGPKRGSRHSGIFIRQLLDDGLAQRDQRLKVADQLLSINEQSTVGISREHAVNLLRSAAATNEVRLRVRHSHSSRYPIEEYRRLLEQDKSTDEDPRGNASTPISQGHSTSSEQWPLPTGRSRRCDEEHLSSRR